MFPLQTLTNKITFVNKICANSLDDTTLRTLDYNE